MLQLCPLCGEESLEVRTLIQDRSLSDVERARKEFVMTRIGGSVSVENLEAVASRVIRPGIISKKRETCRRCKYQRDVYEGLGSVDFKVSRKTCAYCQGIAGSLGPGLPGS